MNILNTKLPCFLNDNYILSTEEEMEFTVDSIEEELEKYGFENKNTDVENFIAHNEINENIFEEAGKMFIYLNICPKFMFDWTKLYFDLLQNSSPDILILTLNRIITIGKIKEDETVTNIARTIFDKITHKLSLKHQTIDRIFKGTRKKNEKSNDFARDINSNMDKRGNSTAQIYQLLKKSKMKGVVFAVIY